MRCRFHSVHRLPTPSGDTPSFRFTSSILLLTHCFLKCSLYALVGGLLGSYHSSRRLVVGWCEQLHLYPLGLLLKFTGYPQIGRCRRLTHLSFPPFGRLILSLHTRHSVPFSVLSTVMIYSLTTVNSRSKTLNLLNLQWNCYSDWCCRRLHGGPSFLCSFAIPSLSLLTSIPKEPNPACTKQTTCVTVVQPFKKYVLSSRIPI